MKIIYHPEKSLDRYRIPFVGVVDWFDDILVRIYPFYFIIKR